MAKIKHGMTATALARRLGIHRSTLYRWRDDMGEVKAKNIVRVAVILDVSVGDLVSGRKMIC